MNYENERQNNQHVAENCTGVTMNYADKTENNGSLRQNYAHMRENNMPMREKMMDIYLNNNHFYPLGTS